MAAAFMPSRPACSQSGCSRLAQPWRRSQRCPTCSASAANAKQAGEGSSSSASAAGAAVPSAAAADGANPTEQPLLLEVSNLSAQVAATRGHLTLKGGVRAGNGAGPGQQQQQQQQILHGVSLVIRQGEATALMGKNGSGKSTLAKVLVGQPTYDVTAGSATFRGHDLLALRPEQRARLGLFLSFQSSPAIPGVTVIDFLQLAINSIRRARGQPDLDPFECFAFVAGQATALGMDPAVLSRDINVGFSGGERKLNEVLQLACLEPELAILDEIDSGLDLDALHAVAHAVQGLRALRPDMGLLIITHYKRLLDLVPPQSVHIMDAGRIVASGGMGLVEELEREGYAHGVLRPLAG
ncbi:hypothetical protein ABPG75_003282 [Micractinium tetrahymenae]